jgi:hypothetical protein
VLLTFHSALKKFNTEPSIGASHQILLHFGKVVSDKKILFSSDQKNITKIAGHSQNRSKRTFGKGGGGGFRYFH